MKISLTRLAEVMSNGVAFTGGYNLVGRCQEAAAHTNDAAGTSFVLGVKTLTGADRATAYPPGNMHLAYT